LDAAKATYTDCCCRRDSYIEALLRECDECWVECCGIVAGTIDRQLDQAEGLVAKLHLKQDQAIQREIGTRLERLSHPLTPRPSISVGTIRGGIATNIVADWCEATIDRRTLPNESVPDAVAEIERLIADLSQADPALEADVEVLQMGPPIETPVTALVVTAGQDIASSLGLDPAVVGYHQASDGRFFAERDIPTVLFGPGDPEAAHTTDEFVDLDEVLTAAQFYALLGQRLLFPDMGNRKR